MALAKQALLLILFGSSVLAQQLSLPPVPVPKLSGRGEGGVFAAPRPYIVQSETVKVLAVMVQFTADNDTRTSGDGQFILTTPTDSVIDAPPHNGQYFRDHLTFLENYFRKVSKGKLIVQSTLVDTVYTLSEQMAAYSPARGESNMKVGNLARDTWQRVDASGRVADFSTYDCFVLFHAGVGRDVDLVSLLGYDPTPFDVPSLYLGLNAFQGFYGSTFPGIVVNGGQDTITNTIIMPETESRSLPGVTGNVLLELGINGLLCASVGSHLGLPDLFDTNTGRSGIGRFGLMDGQGIFSFSGVFPPEPSAWEKYWLGWIDPIVLGAGEHSVVLPAVGLTDTVYRVPVSASEYFLVENRNRDPQRNGQTITSTFNGTTRQQTFVRDTARFNAFDISALAGVVTDVEDFDWSLPGGVDQGGTFFDGGALIWHVDESVIARTININAVNADPTHRGVDVEEADGSQDIGQQYDPFTPGSGSEEGTPLDFWYAGNSSPVNTNTFSSGTHPNSNSYGGANSHVTIKEFSARGPRMTATVVVGDDVVKLLPGFPKSLPNKLHTNALAVADLGGSIAVGKYLFVTTTGEASNRPQREGQAGGDLSRIYAWKTDGTPALRSDGVFRIGGTDFNSFAFPVSAVDVDGDGANEVVINEALAGTPPVQVPQSYLLVCRPVPGVVDSLAPVIFSAEASQRFSTVPVIGDSTISLGGEQGKLFRYRFNAVARDTTQQFSDSSAIVGVTRAGGDVLVLTTGSGIVNSVPGGTGGRSFTGDISGPAAVGEFNGKTLIAFATTDGRLYLVDENLNPVQGFPVVLGAATTTPLALADIDGDGRRDIIAFAGNKIHVYNYAGVALDYFPKTVSSSSVITSNPVVADVDGDGDVDIVAVTEDGLVMAFDRNGSVPSGFPLQAGRGSQSVAAFAIPSLSLSTTKIGLAVASSLDGSVTAWQTGSIGGVLAPKLPWPQYQRDERHSGLAVEPIAGTPASQEFFPAARAYNWPNPVYDGKTFIRYFVKDDARVTVKIFDLAGDLVTELSGQGIGGVDNEIEWNVAGVQSGVYFARIEASGQSGNGVAVVKVAVVK